MGTIIGVSLPSLLPANRVILTQANGQVCFLQLHHGNRPISIAELEASYQLPVVRN